MMLISKLYTWQFLQKWCYCHKMAIEKKFLLLHPTPFKIVTENKPEQQPTHYFVLQNCKGKGSKSLLEKHINFL